MSMKIVYNQSPETDLDLEDRKREIQNMLHRGVCNVTFTKVDGSLRVMPCTLDPTMLPPVPLHETNTNNPIDFPKTKKVNPNTISAWCTDKKEWRSFRVANVNMIEKNND